MCSKESPFAGGFLRAHPCSTCNRLSCLPCWGALMSGDMPPLVGVVLSGARVSRMPGIEPGAWHHGHDKPPSTFIARGIRRTYDRRPGLLAYNAIR